MSQLKNEVSSSDFEVEADDHYAVSKLALIRLVNTLRVGLTVLALVIGVVVLGLGADTLAAYRATSLPEEYLLPLWPAEFDIRPTNALIACGIIVLVANGMALGLSKVSAVSCLNTKAKHLQKSLA